MARYLRLLRRRDFALLWIGATVSALGDGMSFVALVWLTLERGGGAEAVGWLAAAYTGPVVVGGLAAGVVLDRFDPRRVIAADNLVRGMAIASVPIAEAFGGVTTAHLYLVAGVYGLLFMTSLAGVPTLIPALVDEGELTTANAMESLSYSIAGLIGPAISGIVIALAGAPVVLAVDAVTYFVFALCVLGMRPIRRPGSLVDAEPDMRRSVGLADAARFIARTPAVLAITLMYMAINIGEGAFIVVAPTYAREVLGGGAETYGLLLTSLTLGGLVGSLVVGAVGWRWPLGRSIAVAAALTGVAHGLLVLAPGFGGAVVVLAAAGLFGSSLTAWAQTIRMRLIPPELRGRVFALLRTLMQSTSPVGAVLAGTTLGTADIRVTILAAAALMTVPGAIGLFVPALGRSATGEAHDATPRGRERGLPG